MKLRNIKTGEIGEPRVAYQEIYVDTTEHMTYCYKSITEFNEEWEDYRPTEPLIKDPKIRKVVRVWAEANSVGKIIVFDYINDSPFVSAGEVKFAEFGGRLNIGFRTDEKFDTDKIYTIEELCGEEKE